MLVGIGWRAIIPLLSPPPAGSHEHRTACRNRPGHGRRGQGHHRDRRVDRHHRQALRRRRHREFRREPPRLPRDAADHAEPGRLHLRRDPVRRNPAPVDQGRRAVRQGHGRQRHHPGHQGRQGPAAAGRLPGRSRDRRPRRPARAPGGVLQARRALRQVARGDQHRRRHPVGHLHRGQQPCAGALRRAVPGAGPGADGRAGSDHGRQPRHPDLLRGHRSGAAFAVRRAVPAERDARRHDPEGVDGHLRQGLRASRPRSRKSPNPP